MRIQPLAIILAATTLLAGCDRNLGPPPEERHPDSAYIVRVTVAPRALTATTGDGVLFVGARPAQGGPPVYVARYTPAFFPGTYYLTESNRMGLGGNSGGPLAVFARFDRDGDASTSGPEDLVAVTDPALPGNADVALTLDLAQPQPRAPTWSLELTLTGPAPGAALRTSPGATMFVLLRAKGGRVPLAAARFAVPTAFPTTVTLSEAHVMQPPLPPLAELDVVVKVDQDGNPMSTAPGDLEASAPAAAGATIELVAATPR